MRLFVLAISLMISFPCVVLGQWSLGFSAGYTHLNDAKWNQAIDAFNAKVPEKNQMSHLGSGYRFGVDYYVLINEQWKVGAEVAVQIYGTTASLPAMELIPRMHLFSLGIPLHYKITRDRKTTLFTEIIPQFVFGNAEILERAPSESGNHDYRYASQSFSYGGTARIGWELPVEENVNIAPMFFLSYWAPMEFSGFQESLTCTSLGEGNNTSEVFQLGFMVRFSFAPLPN